MNNFIDNVNSIQNYVGLDKKIMPVIKANAYGTYINKDLELISQFDIVAVAIVEEALYLRELGYKKAITIIIGLGEEIEHLNDLFDLII